LHRASDWLGSGGLISLEMHGEAIELPEALDQVVERRFGKAMIRIFRRR
jgi:hypothetical protein